MAKKPTKVVEAAKVVDTLSARLDSYLAAPAHPAAAPLDNEWYKKIGLEVDKDGFNTACTPEEKKEIQAMLKKGKAAKAEKVAKAEKPAKKTKVERKPIFVKPVETKVVGKRKQTTANRLYALMVIPVMVEAGLEREDIIAALMSILGVSRAYAASWINQAKKAA